MSGHDRPPIGVDMLILGVFAWLRVIYEPIGVVTCVDNCYHSILLPPYDVYT